MSFNKVTPKSINDAVSMCKNSMSYRDSYSAIGAINSNSVWQSASKEKLDSALNTLIYTKYKNLIDEFDKVLSVSDLISKYKSLEAENSDLNNRIYSLMDNLYYDEQYTVPSIDENGNEIMVTQTRSVKDYYIESKIRQLESEVSMNLEQMKNIENNVSTIVG